MLIEKPAAATARRVPKWVWRGGALLIALLVIPAILLITRWPFTRENVQKALEDASGRPVEIQTFSDSYFPPGCTAGGIRFLRHKHPDLSPIITIEKLSIRGSFTGMFSSPKRIALVSLAGMHVIIGPKRPDEGPEHVSLNAGQNGQSIAISRITADGATFEFIAAQNAAPYVLKIDKLALTDVGSGAPMHYAAKLTNTVPPGVIRAEGKFGPWNPDDVGSTPVSGSYDYDKMELSHFRSIYGVATARGEFSGPLARIRTHGHVEVAGFRVDGSDHSVPLAVDYQATVNGTNGDVQLDPAIARFRNTRLDVRGWIAGQPEQHGKTATFDLDMPQGRVDDLLTLLDSGAPGMSGPTTLRGHFVWPPGPTPFLRKIRLDLTFGMDRSRFTSSTTQGSIDRLSESAQGEKKDQIEEDPRTVLLKLTGVIHIRDGVASVANTKFHVPGADATARGTYTLTDHRLDLKGTLDTTGHLSETTSGIKSLLVKAITPLLKKRGKERIVPFQITGAYGKTTVTLNWKRLM